MKMKPVLFALIAAAVGGVVQDATEKGLCALDERRNMMRKAEGTEDESETTDTAEEEESLE